MVKSAEKAEKSAEKKLKKTKKDKTPKKAAEDAEGPAAVVEEVCSNTNAILICPFTSADT